LGEAISRVEEWVAQKKVEGRGKNILKISEPPMKGEKMRMQVAIKVHRIDPVRRGPDRGAKKNAE